MQMHEACSRFCMMELFGSNNDNKKGAFLHVHSSRADCARHSFAVLASPALVIIRMFERVNGVAAVAQTSCRQGPEPPPLLIYSCCFTLRLL